MRLKQAEAVGFAPVPVLLVDVMAVVGACKLHPRPCELHTHAHQEALEVAKEPRRFRTWRGVVLRLEAPGRQSAGRLTDVPLGWMEAKCAVGHVRHAQVFTRWQEIFDATGIGPQGESAAASSCRATPASCSLFLFVRPVDVDAVSTDADAVGIKDRPVLIAGDVPAEMLLETVNSALMRRDSRMYGYCARPSVVPKTSPRKRMPGNPARPPSPSGTSVCRKYTKLSVSCLALSKWRLDLFSAHAQHRAVVVFVGAPNRHSDIARERAVDEVAFVQHSAEIPKAHFILVGRLREKRRLNLMSGSSPVGTLPTRPEKRGRHRSYSAGRSMV